MQDFDRSAARIAAVGWQGRPCLWRPGSVQKGPFARALAQDGRTRAATLAQLDAVETQNL